jgi:hypothetical protein
MSQPLLDVSKTRRRQATKTHHELDVDLFTHIPDRRQREAIRARSNHLASSLYSKLSGTHDAVDVMTLRLGGKMLDSARGVHGRIDSSTAFACGRLNKLNACRVEFISGLVMAARTSIRKKGQ